MTMSGHPARPGPGAPGPEGGGPGSREGPAPSGDRAARDDPQGCPEQAWDWVPEAALNYLAHTEGGRTIRALAREAQVAPSTILRRVRRIESSRDDPLVDAALRGLAGRARPEPDALAADPDRLARDAAPILRRLAEPGAVLAVARDMDRGVVVREGPDGEPQRLAVVERPLAEAMGLRDWIACPDAQARILRYRITAQGRAVLRAVLTETARADASRAGLAEAPAAFGHRRSVDADAGEERRLRHMRSILPESPLSALARRRDREGTPFLDRDLVAAGERLREDFELAQQGSGPAPDWEALLVDASQAPGAAGARRGFGPQAARARVAEAMRDLGPGLGDVALRCCCLLEGLEAIERRMDWSARSGKVVLRIALARLVRHYLETDGRTGGLIG